MTGEVKRVDIKGDSTASIVASVEKAIRTGQLAPGDRLPPVRQLSGELGVSASTVAASYRTLKQRGYVSTQGRSGTTVSTRPPLSAPTTTPVPEGTRDLANGNPDPAFLPLLRVRKDYMVDEPRLYGDPQNLSELVEYAQAFFREDGIDAHTVAVVGGALDGIERVLQAHLRPGDRVGVEDPGFQGVIHLVRALGLIPVGIPVDENGPTSQGLEAAFSSGIEALVYTPRFQNPLGAALTGRRAADLRDLLERHDEILLIEDDHMFMFASEPAHSLIVEGWQSWAVVRSITKSHGPDLRLAFVAGDDTTVSRVNGRQSLGTGWVSHILQRIALDLLRSDEADALIERARVTYDRRRKALREGLSRSGIESHGASGFNVWIPVQEEASLVALLQQKGWQVAAGEPFRIASPPAIRITTSTLEPDEARDLVEVLSSSTSAGDRTRTR